MKITSVNVRKIQKDLRFAIAELDTINPILSTNRNVHELTKIIFEPLVTLNEDYKAEYALAQEIVKENDTTYLVKLRQVQQWQILNLFGLYLLLMFGLVVLPLYYHLLAF